MPMIGLTPCGLGLGVELVGAEHVAVVGHRDRGHARARRCARTGRRAGRRRRAWSTRCGRAGGRRSRRTAAIGGGGTPLESDGLVGQAAAASGGRRAVSWGKDLSLRDRRADRARTHRQSDRRHAPARRTGRRRTATRADSAEEARCRQGGALRDPVRRRRPRARRSTAASSAGRSCRCRRWTTRSSRPARPTRRPGRPSPASSTAACSSASGGSEGPEPRRRRRRHRRRPREVTDAGGTVVRAEAVGDMGFAAYFSDTEGNLIGLWETAGVGSPAASRLSVMIACTIRASRSSPRSGARRASRSAISRSRSGSRVRSRLWSWTARGERRPAGEQVAELVVDLVDQAPAGTPAGRRPATPSGVRAPAPRCRSRRCARARRGRAGRRSARAGAFISKTHRQKPSGRRALTRSSSAEPTPWPACAGRDVEVVEPGRR